MIPGRDIVRRERYVGTWLPEPFMDERAEHPDTELEVDESVSLALMLALERLGPAERAAYLLHDVFGYGFEELAEILGKSNAACRKLASRARERVKAGPRRFQASADEHRRLVSGFIAASRAGNLARLQALLSASVEAQGDGGGKVNAAGLLRGRVAVAEFFVRIWRAYEEAGTEVVVEPRWINGAPGVLLFEDGALTTAISLSVAHGAIERIFGQRNPDKLALLAKTVR